MGKTIERKQPVVWRDPAQENEFIPPVIFYNGVYLLVGFFTEKKIRKDLHAGTSLCFMRISK